MAHRIGYCCINNTLSAKGVTTARTMRKATFEERGIVYASELATRNIQDLLVILRWNVYNGVKVFRMGSNLFPWNTEYALHELPDHDHHKELLGEAGRIIMSSGQRVTAHPDHYVKLASATERVAENAIYDLNHHNEVFDLMGLPANHWHCLNIHVGQNYSPDVVERFINRFYLLHSDTQKRLVVENDDKENAFSVRQLYDEIYSRIFTPITFDYFHHTFHTGGMASEDAAKLAASTWDVTPLFHYSESKNINEGATGNPRAHSDFALNYIDDYGLDIDIDLEVKAKELAYFKYLGRNYDITINT
jgi:UV DNA damage endonuclease